MTVRDRPVARLVPTEGEPRTEVSQEKLAEILSLPVDDAAMLTELDEAEAPID